jgi:hypothetical protein
MSAGVRLHVGESRKCVYLPAARARRPRAREPEEMNEDRHVLWCRPHSRTRCRRASRYSLNVGGNALEALHASDFMGTMRRPAEAFRDRDFTLPPGRVW